jgi:hypothetical protein
VRGSTFGGARGIGGRVVRSCAVRREMLGAVYSPASSGFLFFLVLSAHVEFS